MPVRLPSRMPTTKTFRMSANKLILPQSLQRIINTMNTETQSYTTHATYKKASTLQITWLIARRQMLEAIRDRSTLIMSGIFLAFQTVLVLISVGPTLQDHTQA